MRFSLKKLVWFSVFAPPIIFLLHDNPFSIMGMLGIWGVIETFRAADRAKHGSAVHAE